MHHLRMSAQSDDMRKNKKAKKSFIATFQNLFKSSTKRQQGSEMPNNKVELLTYQKNIDVDT